MKRFALVFALLFSISATAQVSPDYTKLASHPRLLIKSGDIEKVHSKLLSDEVFREFHYAVEDKTQQMLTTAPTKRVMTGKRLLSTSRTVLERIGFCSYMYLVTKDEQYAHCAEREMLAVAQYSDWNPKHFLDVAEMMTGMAIGYDWLYDWLSADSRKIIEDAIIEKGLRAATPKMWWYRAHNNWNQVCNAGMVMGALAVYERIPEEAQTLIQRSLEGNPKAQTTYAPDGVYPEGYGYWDYGTWYEVQLIEALRTAIGDSFGLEKTPGFIESAKFINYMQAPSGISFNFADSGYSKDNTNLLLYWFALETGDYSLLYSGHKIVKEKERYGGLCRHAPIALLFAARCDTQNLEPIKEQFWAGQGEVPVFIYRSDFTSSDASYLAAKGGTPMTNHAHMDSGSFVYEWGGVRWASDLGSQSYHSLESKGIKLFARGKPNAPRWKVYRLNNFPHNTLTVNENIHEQHGMATMDKVYNSKSKHGAQFNMTTLFPELSSAIRTIYIGKGDKVTCTDNITAKEANCQVRWNMTTTTKARIIDEHTISLTQNGKEVHLRVTSPKSAKAYIKDNTPPASYDAPNKGSWRVGFECVVPSQKSTTIKVELIPQK